MTDANRKTARSIRRLLVWGLPGLILLGVAILAVDWYWTVPIDARNDYVGREACRECHEKEYALWTGSDHDRAIDPATPQTVLGDFNNAQFTHFGVTSKMARRGDAFRVHTNDAQGKMRWFDVKYVFGFRPLQQYLVEFPDGRVQCLPIAWDTEKKVWFHLYPKEPIPHTDELFWTKPLQNWNYMCAECHSTDLKKNFDLKSNTYHTTYSEIDVSCEACHGPSGLHVQLANSFSPFWDRRAGFGLPNLKATDARVEIETCAPCHCRRRVIYPGFTPGRPLLDYCVPELLDSNCYYPDGQILEEDYEYGSFIQSRMYHENVRCTDCHDPHTYMVKFSTRVRDVSNRLCGQCHLPTKYDTPKHHFHPDSTQPGTKCVECHMPETSYMVADPRRDHSLRIPRPDLTVDLGIPNACNGCHHDQAKNETPRWAVEQVEKWYGKKKGPRHFAHAIAAGRAGDPKGEPLLVDLLQRRDLSAMVRASALLLIAEYGTPDARALLEDGLTHSDALVRASAVRGLEVAYADPARGESRPPADLLEPLLHDPIRAVRIEAARILAREPRSRFQPDDLKTLDAALAEYVAGLEFLADQPPAHLSLGQLHESQGRLDQAEASYRTALRLDPKYPPARSALAMLLSAQNRRPDAEKVLREWIAMDPKEAYAHYWLGLLIGEDESRLAEAVESLSAAATLAPKNARFHYNLGVALQRLGKPANAEKSLLAAVRLSPRSPDYLHALAVLFVQQANWPQAEAFARRLAEASPRDPRVPPLLDALRRRAKPD